MNFLSKIVISVLAWLGIFELFVGIFTHFKYLLTVLLIYCGLLGLILIVIGIFITAFWLMDS